MDATNLMLDIHALQVYAQTYLQFGWVSLFVNLI